MKYRLLKDIPWLKAWEIIEESIKWYVSETGTYDKYKKIVFRPFAEEHPDFFEPIVEKKKFEDLKYWDKVWWIFQNWMVIECVFEWTECKHETFLTKHDAEMERLRREARANVYLPKYGESFWTWFFQCKEASLNYWLAIGRYDYFIWNVHKTKEAAEEYGRKYAKAFEIPNE